MKSAGILRSIHPNLVKIASPELNFTGLLKEIAGWGLPVLLSTGVSKLADIEKAIDVLKDTGGGSGNEMTKIGTTTPPSVCLLHCVTSYPAPETDYNLKVLPNLAAIFGIPAGVSDHSGDPELVPALAVSMGAVAIEKHFCLSKNDLGLDDPIALPPEDFSRMVKAIRKAAASNTQETIAHYKCEKGTELVERILGSGVKELAPSEKANYRLTNRSIHALKDIVAGGILKKDDYAVLRTEKILRPGLEPYWEETIEGKIAKNFIPDGEGIRFEDIF
jgi:sialic acid synthase SpsE